MVEKELSLQNDNSKLNGDANALQIDTKQRPEIIESTIKSQTPPPPNEPITEVSTDSNDDQDNSFKLLQFPMGKGWFAQVSWIITWPIHLIFRFTIPDCENPKFKKWFPVTFSMCIVWIGSLSYLVAWFITVVGE